MKCLALIVLLSSVMAKAEITIARNGQAAAAIIRQTGLTVPEENALEEFVNGLRRVTGARFELVDEKEVNDSQARILVGAGEVARREFTEIDFGKLGAEELIIKSKGKLLLVAGGQPRGTLYAVSTFLQKFCGVRWWTPWADRWPEQSTLSLPETDLRIRPPFEYREPFWYPAFNARWAVRNRCNGRSAAIPDDWGGCIRYKGFVHTFYPLVPPDPYFGQHPEWFSLIDGKRTTERAQLCLTNPKLREFMVERVKEWLRSAPEARLISVSQNDWHGACQCENCRALDDAEGSASGTMLDFVNFIAEKIEPEFPKVAIDTLAYQYTRRPPRHLRPRPNVIVRLCSIECNFREPLSHPSNQAFADDIRGWSKICQRLYIWDYTTDFAHYVQPHPNWFTLGANVRFFAEHGVAGVFEQGAYQSYGSEMAELRAWVLAQLLWDPGQDDEALINEFLDGYYGAKAAPFIRQYLELMKQASAGTKLTCFSGSDVPFLDFKPLAEAEKLWQLAEKSVAGDADLQARVRVGHLPLGYAWLVRWEKLQQQRNDTGAQWPLPKSKKEFADDWVMRARGETDKPWSQVHLINEGGVTLDQFADRFK